MKICSFCKENKSENCFNKDKRAKNGLKSQCKECEKRYRKRAELNRDPEKKKAYAKRYRESHKEIERARFKKWKLKNPDKYKQVHKNSKMKNRCKCSVFDNTINLEYLYNRDRGICKICGEPCDYDDKIIKNNVVIVGNRYPSIDHIIPLSKGGSHTWDNVQLAHKLCNSIKSDKI